MRPFLLFCPGGEVPEAISTPLEKAGAEVLVACSLEEAGDLLHASRPDVLLVVPPGTAADAVKLLSLLPESVAPPSVFVLADDGAPNPPLAFETIARTSWNRAAAALREGSHDPAPAILLSRVQLTVLLELWEQLAAGGCGFVERALRALSLSLDASRVSLFRWKAGSAVARLEASSLGAGVVGHEVEIARYPELRAAASRSGPVLVEEIDRDPLMGDARSFFEGARIRSLLCRQLPGEGSDLYLHAIRERVPFGLVDVALLGASARLLAAAHDARRPLEPAQQKQLADALAETSRQLETLEASAREAEIMRARFWTAAAHELRTPLAIVRSYLEVVMTDLAAEVPERPTQLLKTAADGLSRLERLIADVLDAAVAGRDADGANVKRVAWPKAPGRDGASR